MQDSENNPHEMEIEVNEERALECRKKYQLFESQFPTMQNQFQQSNEKIYFIVSSKFIRQWKAFCSSTQASRVQPQPMNIDLIDQSTKNLKEGLFQSEHFQIISLKVYEHLSGFQICQTLRRVAYGQPKQKKVPIYTKKFNYLTLCQQDLIQVDKKTKKLPQMKLSEIKSLSDNNSLEDLMRQIIAEKLFTKKYRTRIWKHQKDITMQKLFEHIAKQCKPQSYQSMKIKGLGKLVQDNETKIGQLNMQQEDYFLMQCVLNDKSVITSADQGRCQSCYNHKKLTHFCNCKLVGYCSEECLQKDKKYHIQRCKFAQQEQLKKPIQMTMTQNSRKGVVGLENLGNTCFMNSSLQCLSHTLPLTIYFLEQSYAHQINRDNPIGSKGRLAQAYANFIKNMWCESERVFRPFRLKGAISDINKMFSGYAQHDSQELFSFLVDGIHQDLNRIKRKPYVQSVDSNGRSDEIVSKQSWLAYVQRNQSIITDTMVGQYKSKVICPDCGRESITFDPFITMTLPIPEKSSKQIKLYVLYSDNEECTEQISVTFKKRTVEEIYQKVATTINKKSSDIQLYILSFDENIYSFTKTSQKQLFYKMDQQNENIFAIEVSPAQKILQNKIQLIFRFSKLTFGRDYHPFWYKRPFWFDSQKAKGVDLIKRVLKYLYHDTYDLSVNRFQKNQCAYYRGEEEKAKTYEQYEEFMLNKENRPFEIYLRWGKKIKTKYTGRIDVEFQQQQAIGDQEQINKIIKIQDIADYQIDVRFSNKGLDFYSLNRLKSYNNKTKSTSTRDYDDEQTKVPLSACFQAFQNPELLEKGNQWFCPSCKDHKLATKQMYIYKLPQILILHLKRFKVKGVVSRQKNQANIDFPDRLDMSPYIQCHEPINSYIPFVQSQNKYEAPSYQIEVRENSEPVYELYAVSNHYGSLGGGHYTAYAKNDQKWYSFNDSSVSGVDAGKVKGSGAYMLFYRRALEK